MRFRPGRIFYNGRRLNSKNNPGDFVLFIISLRLLTVFLMIGLGWLARRLQVIDVAATNRLSRLLVYFIYPALVFSSMVQSFSLDSLARKWILPVGALAIMATGFVFGLVWLKLVGGFNSREGRAFHFQATINNYSFLAMPLALFYWGEEGLAGVVFSTLGSELAMWTLGVYAIGKSRLSWQVFRQLLSPPMVAIVCALLVILLRDAAGLAFLASSVSAIEAETGAAALWAAWLDGLSMFGLATIPLAMVVAGSRIADLKQRHLLRYRQLRVVAVRLLVVPGLAMIWIFRLPIDADIAGLLSLIAVMPSAVSSVVISELYDGDVEFAAASVLLTHLFCLITIPLWLTVLLNVV